MPTHYLSPDKFEDDPEPAGKLEMIVRQNKGGTINHIDIGSKQIIYDDTGFDMAPLPYLSGLSDAYKDMIKVMDTKLEQYRQYLDKLDAESKKKRFGDYLPKFVRKISSLIGSYESDLHEAIGREKENITEFDLVDTYLTQGASFLNKKLKNADEKEIKLSINQCLESTSRLTSKIQEIITLAKKAKKYYENLRI